MMEQNGTEPLNDQPSSAPMAEGEILPAIPSKVPSVREVIPEKALSPRYQRAAQHVAEDILTDDEIAAECGCSRSQLARWKKRSDFIKAVEAIRTEYRKQVLSSGLARREIRVKKLTEQFKALENTVKARAACSVGVPGGEYGFVTKRLKGVGMGKHAQVVEEYEIDTFTSKELRAISEQIAVEVGDRVEQHSHVHRVLFDMMSPQELEQYADTGAIPDRLRAQMGPAGLLIGGR